MKTKSDHFDGLKFFNPHGNNDKKLSDLLRWRKSHGRVSWPKWRENLATPNVQKNVPKNKMALTFVNHATMLIQVSDLNILTDPVWSKRVSPTQWVGPKRVRPPGLEFEKLPPVSLVLVSHNHYDHMDQETLRKLEKRFSPQFLVAAGDRKIVKSFGAKKVEELDWWDSFSHEGREVTFVPSKHWSGRGLRDRRKSLWGGFVINDQNRQLYFAGDAAYSPHFKEISERFKNIKISLLPIGAYEPRWFMKESHMNPEEAVKAHLDLKSKNSVGIHFGTFRLTDEGIDDPLIHLKEAKERLGLPFDEFIALLEGETRIFDF